METIKRRWRAWCRYWAPAYQPPLESGVMVGWPLRPATEAERAELLARLTEDRTA